MYDVDVEVLEDDDEPGYQSPTVPKLTNNAPPVPTLQPTPRPSSSPSESNSSGNSDSGTDKLLTSPIAGILVEFKVRVGDTVKENDPVAIIEAMKMNTNISSPVSGKVKEIKSNPGEAVQQGQVLLTFE
ncbi:MAG: acetyl-CoA carboxylase biotin carboxyl carrier protein subunit [Chloroflexaceae bacterium]|nr:acetyl-CoA carboxylase biotin carboxyl carrier protein subunit [Chloroflexaceae bacterium]NJL34180.1 acetyl-CoA carboxylase biotin carboxyl carrier protein subunit [Chloroflexaceae bacterium]NJO04990.1 acetyl-CoA carboxylase biotin carboxyl carrier protein subunit [Chloroflexaceae bacterium]